MLKRITILALGVFLVGTAACGSSSYRRAYAVLDRAEAAIVEIHALYDQANVNLAKKRIAS